MSLNVGIFLNPKFVMTILCRSSSMISVFGNPFTNHFISSLMFLSISISDMMTRFSIPVRQCFTISLPICGFKSRTSSSFTLLSLCWSLGESIKVPSSLTSIEIDENFSKL